MSTLSGIVSKGEKGKTKYQSIDINSLYRSSRGESLEQHQQKNTVPRKHGMQSLGKVPSARRPPANLPSLRSEISSSDPAVSLVPSGGSGWATTKEATSTTNTTTTANTPSDNTTTNSISAQCTTGPAPATLAIQHPPLPGQQNNLQSSHPSEAGNKSTWSAIMSKPGDAAIGYAGLVESGRGVRGALGLSFLAHQSPQFQHEFPSLSGQSSASVSIQSQGQQQIPTATNAITSAAQHQSMLQQQSHSHNHSGGGPTGQQQPQQTREMNAQYGPGPSLRPQTEGSWIQGGSRIQGGPGTGAVAGVAGSGNIQGGPGLPVGPTPGQTENPAGGRPNLGPSPGMVMVPAGQQHPGPQSNQPQVPAGQHQVGPNMHHYRGIIPPFMYKGNFTGGNFPAQMPASGQRPRFNYPADRSPARQQRQDRDRGGPPPVDEEIQTRPIIKEEDLSRMDEISCEAGWTATDDIDYNQKLAFSDDETDDQLSTTASNKKEDRKEQEKLAHEEKHVQEDNNKELNSREKDQKENNINVNVRNDARIEPRNEPRNDIQMLRSWNNQGPMSRDYRGPPGPPPPNYPPQQPLRTAHSLRAGDEEELWNQRRREQISEKVASAVELARQRKEEEEKRFQENIKQAAAKKLQDLENKLKEKHKQKDEEHQSSGQLNNDSNKSSSLVPASAPSNTAIIDWERDREARDVRERSRTSSSEGAGKEAEVKAGREQSSSTGQQPTSEFRQIERPSFMRQQQQAADQPPTSLPPGGGGNTANNRSERDRERERDRDQREMREPAFSRLFQSNLPPRFQKQQAERSGAGAGGASNNRLSPSAERSQPVSFSQQYDPSRWVHNHSNSLNNNMKSGLRRTRADSEVSGPLDDEVNGRPNSRAPPPMRADERHRHSGHRAGSGYEPGRKQAPDASYYEEYPRRGSERYKDYDDRHTSNRDGVGSWADHTERRGYDDKSDGRDARDKKDNYDNYSKGPGSQDTFDEQQPVAQQQHVRSESSGQEWREDRRGDIRVHDDRAVPSNDIGGRRGDEQRGERPQRPDSRDSRTSRESRTSLRGPGDDEGGSNSGSFHKPLRDSGTGSWAACNDFPDYDDNKGKQQHQRDIFRDDIRERERDRDRDRDRDVPSSVRDRRQQSGPVIKDKLDQDELKRNIGPLKRGGSDAQDKKDKQSKNNSELLSNDSKKDSGSEVWSRSKPERNENGGRNSPKVSSWADAVSPSFEKEEEEKLMLIDSQHINDDDDNKKLNDLKQSVDKLSLDSNKRGSSDDADKDDQKDDKRDKKSRNRASSSGSRGPRGGEPRGPRQWGSGGGGGGGSSSGAFNVYGQRWRGADVPSRGRRGGAPRSVGGRPGSGKSGNYERTDSELSGDELGSSMPVESTKDDRRSSSARSPKPSVPKGEKDERNRNVASLRKDEQQQQQQSSRGGEYGQSRSEKRSERGDYEVRGSGRPSREGFAPSGEPSRRGRGGFRNNRGPTATTGSTASGRMEGYGPPPSKSPFSSERVDDKHSSSGQGQQHSSTPSPSEHEDVPGVPNQSESSDDKIIAKQQALTAGITGRHAKSPNRLNANHGGVNVPGGHLGSAPRPAKKEDSRSKRARSGSRRGRGGGERSRVMNNINSVINKQNSGDPGNEDWETTSENSEDHPDERKDGHGPRSNKSFGARGDRQNVNAMGNNRELHGRDQRGPRGDKGPKSSNSQSNRTSGTEKSRNIQNVSERGGNRDGLQRNHHSGNVLPLIQNSQSQNGRTRSQGSINIGPVNSIKSMMNKDTTVNRIDEIKLNDPNLVNQALNEISNKSQSKDKRGMHVVDADMDSNCVGGDDVTNVGDDNKLDADGFQEVRSKKNVKESSRQQQKEEQQTSKPGRRDREKDRGQRDRSKSKTNGAHSQQQQQQQQQGQNVPLMLGQSMNQSSGGSSTKQYERNVNRLIAPRFQKQQRLAKHHQVRAGSGGNESSDSATGKALNQQANTVKDALGTVAPPPIVNAWDKPFTGGPSSRSPPSPSVVAVPTELQLMSGLAPGTQSNVGAEHEPGQVDLQQQQPGNSSTGGSQRNSPNCDKIPGGGKLVQSCTGQDKASADASSPPVQTLIFENTNYSKSTKNTVGSSNDMAIKSKYSNHMKSQSRDKRASDIDDDGQLHQQQTLAVAFSNKANDLMKDKVSQQQQQQQEPIQMPLSFNNKEDNADMKLDFTFDSDLTQLTEDKSKSLGMPRSMHMTGAQSTISPSTAELNLKIASVKKVWESAPPMPTVVEHEVDGNVVSNANSFPQAFESNDVDDTYSAHQQYNQGNMKNEITTSTNVCKLVPPQVKPQQQSSGGGGAQPGSSVPGPSPIGPGQSPIGHPPASLQGPLSPPPFNSTGQPSHINYQEFAQYPGSQAAQYGSMSAIPSPPAVLFNTGSGQLPAQAGGLYGAFQLDQSRSPFTQYPPYAASLQSSFNQQNMYLQQPPPPHAPNAPTPDIYQSNLSQYRITAAAAPPFGQNQQLSNNPNTVLISSSSNSLMSASVKPSSQPIGAIGTKAPHFQAPSAPPQPNQLAYIPYDPNQVLGVSGSYMGNSQLVQRPGPNVQPSANNYYSATSADVFSGSQTGFYQPGGAAQQTGAHYGLQGFGQHSQSLATGNAAPVGLQNFSSQFLSGSGLQIAAAAAAQQYRNPTGGLPGPANAAATFLSKHQQQEQPRQLKSPSGNQQDVLASVFSSTPQIPSPKSRKQQSSSQQSQPSPTQHHKFQQYQGVSQSALVSSYTNYVLQQNVRAMGMPPRGGIQPSQQRYPPPIQRPVVPFPPGPNPNNSQQGQQQQNCMPNQQQQTQMNRHRPNIHQQQQQRNMKMQQQYYSGQSNPKMDSNDKVDSHNDKISDSNVGNQSNGNKNNANPPESDHKEEVSQQNE